MKTTPFIGARYDRRTGQYVPQVNGFDVSPTTFEEKRALEIAAEVALRDPDNFTLFSNSPETLTMLERVLGEYLMRDPDTGPLSKLTLEQAHAAVAKARGTPGKEPALPAPTPDRLTDALEALQECVDLLRISEVRFKICDGGKGNLGGASSYHRAINKAHKVLRPKA